MRGSGHLDLGGLDHQVFQVMWPRPRTLITAIAHFPGRSSEPAFLSAELRDDVFPGDADDFERSAVFSAFAAVGAASSRGSPP